MYANVRAWFKAILIKVYRVLSPPSCRILLLDKVFRDYCFALIFRDDTAANRTVRVKARTTSEQNRNRVTRQTMYNSGRSYVRDYVATAETQNVHHASSIMRSVQFRRVARGSIRGGLESARICRRVARKIQNIVLASFYPLGTKM